jgi:DNA-binding transcriptional LysR family regulator
MSQNKANLDPWHVLRTVIDAGGFAQAADQLQRSQSAISYAVSKLQEQLGVQLLTIKGRRAVLTEHGSLLLARARTLLDEYNNDVLELAEALRHGHEPALTLTIDSFCPTRFLREVLGEFQTHFPKTSISINQAHSDYLIGDRSAAVGKHELLISSQRIWETSCQDIGELVFIAVAHPNHPLFGTESPLSSHHLSEHRRVVIGSPEGNLIPAKTTETDFACWYVSNHQHAVQAILMGQAYGWLQEDLIGDELAEEKLKRLSLGNGERYSLPLYLQYDPYRQLGPAGQALIKLIKKYFNQSQLH